MSTFHQKWYLMSVRVWMIDSWTLAKVWTGKTDFNDHYVKNADSKFVSDYCLLLHNLSSLFWTLRLYHITRIKFKSQSTYWWFVWHEFGALCDGDYAELHTDVRSASVKLIPKGRTWCPKWFVHENMRQFCISNLQSLFFFAPSNHNLTSVGFFSTEPNLRKSSSLSASVFRDEDQVEKASRLLSETIRMLPGECPRVDNMLLFWRSRIQVEFTLRRNQESVGRSLHDAGVMALKPRCE